MILSVVSHLHKQQKGKGQSIYQKELRGNGPGGADAKLSSLLRKVTEINILPTVRCTWSPTELVQMQFVSP